MKAASLASLALASMAGLAARARVASADEPDYASILEKKSPAVVTVKPQPINEAVRWR